MIHIKLTLKFQFQVTLIFKLLLSTLKFTWLELLSFSFVMILPQTFQILNNCNNANRLRILNWALYLYYSQIEQFERLTQSNANTISEQMNKGNFDCDNKHKKLATVKLTPNINLKTYDELTCFSKTINIICNRKNLKKNY